MFTLSADGAPKVSSIVINFESIKIGAARHTINVVMDAAKSYALDPSLKRSN